MALGKQLPIRLEADVEKRLEAAASKNGTTKSALIRLLAKTFVEQVIGIDGGVSLPPRWAQLLPQADARAAKSTRAKGPVHRLAVHLNDESSTEPTPPRQEGRVHPKPPRKKKP
jgi:hypothetical protein